ncbi:hypothetical protein NEUTE1DRAFT_138128 [Neurospora tetrasperma FGSC 2508]|uniref:Uncharacterized protein n=1 Tax=Neurospora tetrasperma (strain FGSC 2508 / ATCC MYA-4615 / P0657) TaxID=510951 RepID=F8MLC2_NEUT8|nr:uncharacterized protein NEUTE1DRAFT_138128 [Neurospora tetrasperma FGSC 2508]EGO58395.1 hypothetical protein NEUTE1DRAFT_138128 [Neurospora tetrasperma FGSC 2508]
MAPHLSTTSGDEGEGASASHPIDASIINHGNAIETTSHHIMAAASPASGQVIGSIIHQGTGSFLNPIEAQAGNFIPSANTTQTIGPVFNDIPAQAASPFMDLPAQEGADPIPEEGAVPVADPFILDFDISVFKKVLGNGIPCGQPA